MSVTMEQVLTKLSRMEPDYDDAAMLGPESLPHLEQLADGRDVLMAAKAISLASMINTGRTVDLLLKASQHPAPTLRVQAAWGVANLPRGAAERVLSVLLDDQDTGVRRVSLRSARTVFPRGTMPPAIQQKIAALSKKDPDPFIRATALQLSM
jgi:hypothetical protein